MSEHWTATVMRLNPATDVLVAKVKGRISYDQADRMKRQIRAVLPEVKLLILDEGCEFAVITRRRAKTLVRAGRRR